MRARAGIGLLVIVLLVAGCGGQASSPQDVLPNAAAVPGWTSSSEVQSFGPENLYDLVNGQADAFFAYAFERVSVQTYENDEGASLRVEIWQLATPSDAYGLFTTYRSGTPVAVGREGDGDPGRRLDFWQDRYFVRLFAPQPLPDEELQSFAQTIVDTLPAGGERPELLERLLQERLVEHSTIFFHQEISIQNDLWLGGQNLLGLSSATDGLLARYDLEGGTAYLLLVRYPDAEAAAIGLEGLQAVDIDNLVIAHGSDRILGAVFGPVGEPEARALLARALEEE